LGLKIFEKSSCNVLGNLKWFVSMANKHQSKEFDRLIEVARTKGFRIVVRGFGDTFILYPEDKNKSMRVFHRGDKGVKPLESYLKKNS
jgi:hypothetical protein